MVSEHVTDRLLLVGTAHVSSESVKEVAAAVETYKPDVVAVELDAMRLEALRDQKKWESTPVHKLLKSDKLYLFMVQVMLSSYQRRMGEVYGAEPGTEMLAAVQQAELHGATVMLVDRDVGVTMRRAFGLMRLREKFRLSWELFKAMFGGEEEEEDGKAPTVAELTREDAVTSMMNEFGRMAPTIKHVVLDERDAYIATKLREPLDQGKKVLGVIGAGHLPGIRKRIQENAPLADLPALEQMPAKRFSLTKFLLTWVLPLAIVGVFAYLGWKGVQEGNFEELRDALVIWVVVTGTLAALGALLARGHPFSILTAFVAAPVTTLHPALAAGWFAGIVEAWVRTPTVHDFRTLSHLKTMKDFFGNRVIRVLMVAALANLGAMGGFFLGGWLIVRMVGA